NEIIKTKNLSFDVIVLTLGNDAFTSGMPHICMWHDLQADYLELRSVLLCLSAEVLSRYEQFLKDIDGDYEKSRDIAQIKKLAGAMDALLPQCMEDFDFTGFGDAYKALLLALIVEKLYLEDYLNKLIYERSDVASIDEVQRWQSLLGQGRITLETFTGNCLYVKLLTLYYTYTQRTEYLKNHHPFIFRNFVEEYPGLEHEPVNEGGTYILLCHKEGGGDYIVVADFSLPYKIDCCCHVPLCDESLKLPPVATDDYAETVRGATVEIVGPGNDYSLANDKIVIVDYPKEEGGTDKGGTVKLKGKNNIFSYKPPKDFTGIDTFAYTIRNEAELESSATVTVLVREKYEKHIKAADDLAATERMTPVLIDVLANDRIYEKTALILPGDTSYLGAKLTIEDKKIKYVPVREGKDSFKYRLVDEGRKEESEAEVTLIVYCCECLEVVHQDKSAEIYVLNDLEKEMKADLKLFTTDIEKVSAQIVTEKKGTATVKEGIIYYVPPGGFAGRDSFGYRIDQKEKGYRRSCHVKVVVLSEGGEVAPPSCEMPDLSYAVNGTEAGEFVVDFSAKPETDHVKVTGVENLTLAEFKINRRSEKSIHIAWLKPFTSFSFTYTGIDTRTGAECEGTIALVSKKIFTIPERDLVAIEGKYVDIIPSDPRLKYNVESVGTFFDDVNNKYEANPDNFMAGSENTAITREFAGVFDALVDNATDISKAIEVSGATPELTKKRELNLELMNSSLSGYLRTLGAEDKDLKATDGTSEYIATGLKESISRLDAEDKAVVTENMTAIVTENPEKKVLNKNIKLLM
ncbi:MAG: Ig-like domain-containing protein, partial [Deltaproteobacteria bacterium]|nr:Ig-like domain-containing protein [Deltaproteobacteria bacterium]